MRVNFKYFQILLLSACIVLSNWALGQSSDGEIRNMVSKNRKAIGLSETDTQNFVVTSNYKDAGNGIEYAYIQQTYKDIRVFNVVISLAFKSDRLLYSSG